MVLNRLDRLGNWNPQLVRELKGRLKPHNLAIAAFLSLLGQLLIAMTCPMSSNGSFDINWSLLWSNLFVRLTWVGTLVLLGVGTYLLINDLAKEERRGTLNFLRLSPQSTQSILVGKLLGVPSLVYLAIVLAAPLHLWSGLAAKIPLGLILRFYGVGLASCLFFYSAALLYGLTCSWLGGLQAGLGSGIVVAFLISLGFIPFVGNWSLLFSPLAILPYLVSPTSPHSYASIHNISLETLERWTWFSLPLGESAASFIGFVLLNYGLWTYLLWRSLQRCFRDQNATILSKPQSYLFTACFELLTVGSIKGHYYYLVEDTLEQIFTNLLLFLWLIAAVSPHRTALKDWARHRQGRLATGKRFWNHSLMQDLIWDEKSPAIVAIFLNLLLAGAMIVRLFFLPKAIFPEAIATSETIYTSAIFEVILSLNVILVYAVVAQRILLWRTQKRGLWAVGAVACLIFLGVASDFWLLPAALFSPLPTTMVLKSTTTFFLVLLGQWSIVAFLSWQLMRQLRWAGKSNNKTLLTGR